MEKEIENKNNKYQLHGYQEWYWTSNGKLRFRGCWKNGLKIGYMECHNRNWKYTSFNIR